MRKLLSIILMLALILTLSACKDKNYYDTSINVQFFADTNDSENDNPTIIKDLSTGDKITKPADPVKPGYEFVGWFTDHELTNEWDFDNDTVGDKTMYLFAKWFSVGFQITYITYGGELAEKYELEGGGYGEGFKPGDLTSLPIPTQRGYLFKAWYLYEWVDESSTIPGDGGYTTLPDDAVASITLYAHWEIINSRVLFKANFPIDDQGPANPSPKFMDFGEEIQFDTFEDTLGYRFVGWCKTSAGCDDNPDWWFVNGTPFDWTSNQTLYGIWEEIE